MDSYWWTTTLKELWLSSGSIADWATQRQQYKTQATQNGDAALVSQMEAESDKLLNQSINTSDARTSNMNSTACNLTDLAVAMDKRRFQNRWVHIDKTKYPNANAIVQQWRSVFPSDAGHIDRCISWKTDLPTTLQRLGIIVTDEIKDEWWEEKEEKSEWNFFTNVVRNYIEPLYKHWWQAISNLINGSLEELEQWTVLNPWATDRTASALENYAQTNYWTNYYWLTEDQKAEAREAIETDEWMEVYKPTVQRILSKWAEAWLDAYFAVAWRPIMALNSVWAEIPYVRDILAWFWSVIQFWWHIINQLPLLKQFRDSLQTEEEKEERDQYVWWWGLWKLSWKKWKKAVWNILDFIIKSIKDPRDIIKQFQKLPKKVEEKLPTAWDAIANMNKMTLEDKMWFKSKYWQEYWDFLNEEWIVEWREWTIEKLQYMKNEDLGKIEKAIESIEWDFYVWNEAMVNLIDDVVSYAEHTLESQSRPKVYNELKRIRDKFYSNWMKLSWDEVLYMLRYFRNNNKFAYWKAASTQPLAVTRATNIDSSVSRMLSKIAEDNWFENMREINMRISKSISVLNALWREAMKAYWDIPFSDWLQFYSLKQLPANLLKTYLNSNRFKKGYVNWMNKRTWFEPKDPLNVDMSKIIESNAAKRVQNWYESAMWDWTPKLNYEWPEVASDAVDRAVQRAKDKPNPKDLVIETNANDPYNVPKEVVEWKKVDEISQNPKDYWQKTIWD